MPLFPGPNGDDTWIAVVSDGDFTWDADTGYDTLVLDYSAATMGFNAYREGRYYRIDPYFVDDHNCWAYDIEKVIITGGSGDDGIESGYAGDTIDGGAGSDELHIERSATTPFVFSARDAATAVGTTASDGTFVRNMERLGAVVTGSGDDQLTVSHGNGDFTWDGNGGYDTLVLDYSDATVRFNAYREGSYYRIDDNFVDDHNAWAYDIERVAITGGSGDDGIESGYAGDTIDGGAGSDELHIDRSANANFVFSARDAATATGTTASDGTFVRNMERLGQVVTDSGSDQLTVTYGNGEFTWDGNGGFDILVLDYSDATVRFNAYREGSYYRIDDNFVDDNTGWARDIEQVAITGGAGDDGIESGYVGDTIDGGAGSDELHIYRTTGTDFVFSAKDAATSVGTTASDGTFARNMERLGTVVTGSGDDRLTVSFGNGDFTWDGNGGHDTLILDYSNATAGFNAYREGSYYRIDLNFVDDNNCWAYTIERVEVIGGSGDDQVTGTQNGDRLDGGAGSDSLSGGAGHDTYVVDSAGDVIIEAASAGTDRVESSTDYSLGANLEVLALTGGADIDGGGNGLANSLTGNSGNNALDGGAGNDTLSGGLGDDTYIVDTIGDTVMENSGEGTDTIVASLSYSLTGKQVENLTLTGSAAITATGNSGANVLIGNDGANMLDAGAGHDRLDGGLAADTMIGGTGNDSYVVDNAGDVVTELAGGGADLIESSLTYVLGADIEHLTLIGSAAINATGNVLSNILTGNSAVNVLTGGSANDTYYVQNTADNVVEASNQGTDIIYSTVTYSLTGRYAETITLIGIANANATGNSQTNSLNGNDGRNTLNGKGGADSLSGGLGADIFLFEAGSGVDTITDFSAAQNDSLNINAYTGGVANAGMVTQNGLNVVITLGGGNVITVNNATAGDVIAHMVW